mmetsp:Transcript_16323/g.28913  ORF Transcript_16323/g.28913 Transcript_16323/m.28913 type:complete len:268 (-) Transcript_16323:240-1043(-)|eukprot:CAMPEP_0184523274 /NCGR_PEP_ID=MMETSP0198_2-20121128/8787_1 /TAXON_ID=1112570 /ORGANISM="Thraustochytrium sp., Strain LLF1b" /LENGTH=267 /DNA_ID=CAMNT_0026914275 /DNA_START=239 /DNA_END=1042 /DNA_ORIENTATION=+
MAGPVLLAALLSASWSSRQALIALSEVIEEEKARAAQSAESLAQPRLNVKIASISASSRTLNYTKAGSKERTRQAQAEGSSETQTLLQLGRGSFAQNGESLKRRKRALRASREALKTWCIFALVRICEDFNYFGLTWIPGFTTLKVLVLGWFTWSKSPSFVSSTYDSIVVPFFYKASKLIDRASRRALQLALEALDVIQQHSWSTDLAKSSNDDLVKWKNYLQNVLKRVEQRQVKLEEYESSTSSFTSPYPSPSRPSHVSSKSKNEA